MRYALDGIVGLLETFLAQDGENEVLPHEAIRSDLAGIQLLQTPLAGCSSADDPLYRFLKRPEAVGRWHYLPADWLPGARTVLSFFFPFAEEVRSSNALGEREPSPQWLHARIEGQAVIGRACQFLAKSLRDAGWLAVVPALDPRFSAVEPAGSNPLFPPEASYTSLWSERHVAYVSGLGTFGLSKSLITAKGTCGRFASVITDMPCPPTHRAYSGLYEYCSFCGACVRRCPTGAISLETGKSHPLCSSFVDWTKEAFAPRYGCGKCQTGVPCQAGIPAGNHGTKDSSGLPAVPPDMPGPV